jgi:hypothetical protein
MIICRGREDLLVKRVPSPPAPHHPKNFFKKKKAFWIARGKKM